MLKAVFFDLDDTLFDHRLCARTALAELHKVHPAFESYPFAEFERLHATFLEELHRRVLTGELTIDYARRERFRRMFEASGTVPDESVVEQAAAVYRRGYVSIRQPVAGAARLLELTRTRARIGIVSNNLLEEQQGKLRHCGLASYVDVLVVSEEAGVSKPDPRIFEIALDRIGCRAGEVVMVGDSWAADVIGARDAGIRAIWFNPSGKRPPDPAADVPELRSLEPADAALHVIFEQAAPRTLGSRT